LHRALFIELVEVAVEIYLGTKIYGTSKIHNAFRCQKA
jgi:hypothetical protein